MEGGTMYASQSAMTEAIFCTFRQCTFDTYDVALPNFYPAYSAPSATEPQAFYPVYEDCVWRTAHSGTPTGICGHFRGVNKVTTPDPGNIIFAFGSLSKIDYGKVYLNGALQGVQTYAATNVTTDRAFDADTAAIAELSDVVGTLIADLRARGIVV
jgi:hypothetical protein